MRILIFDGLIIGGLFAIMLHTRARQLKRDAQQTMLDLLRTQKKFELEQKLKEQAEAQARTDYLTGLFNRRHFVELAERELERSSRYRRPFTMLLIDIDHFKAINDNWGHSFGDAVLQEVSRLMSGALRSVDIFGRIGGEEFAAVIVESEGREAIEVAQRICVTVADALIVSTDGGGFHVTVSIGLAQLDGRNINFDTVLNEADQAMYQAKTTGRNRVEVHASAKCSEERNSQIATISHDDVREAVGCGPQI
jgi:diguanylate cyclase (GGDEF)-like protein